MSSTSYGSLLHLLHDVHHCREAFYACFAALLQTAAIQRFLLFLCILLGVLVLSVLLLFFGRETTFRLSILIILSRFRSFCLFHFPNSFSAGYSRMNSRPEHLSWRKRSPLDRNVVWQSSKVSFRASQLGLQLLRYVFCVLFQKTHETED